jgi:putative AlgH/UPF0301 family transcriptional regulator
MTTNSLLQISLCLSLLVSCAGFVTQSAVRDSRTVLFYGPDDQDEEYKNQDTDEYLLDNHFGDSTTNDWRQFRAKLVAQEEKEKVENDPIASFMKAQDEKNNVAPERPEQTEYRWAHPMDNLETGCVLVASETLGGLFYGKVLLVVDHSSAGSTAIVVNSLFPGGLAQVSANQGSVLDDQLLSAFPTTDVAYGGNVRMAEYSLLHGFGEVEGAKRVTPGVYFGGESALVNEVSNGRFDPQNALFVKGKVTWSPGRLQAEIDSGKWYIGSASPNFILRNAGATLSEHDDPSDLWKDILTCMGGQFANIADKYAGNLKP